MKVFLPHPLKVKANLSGATLSCSVKSKNQAHISWESCCASPHSSLCVPSHLIYKRSTEICMRSMMPELKIHSNREYIDSSVIELSLSFLCHSSHRSLSRLMYYQKHATPPFSLSLFLSDTIYLPLSHSAPPLLSFSFFLLCHSLPLFAWQSRANSHSKKSLGFFSNPPQRHFSLQNSRNQKQVAAAIFWYSDFRGSIFWQTNIPFGIMYPLQSNFIIHNYSLHLHCKNAKNCYIARVER